MHAKISPSKGSRVKANLLVECLLAGKEMDLGKGGKVLQKIYADPQGLEVWKETNPRLRVLSGSRE